MRDAPDSSQEFLYGPNGSPIEEMCIATGAVTYLYGDQLGSIVMMTDSSGNVTGTRSYSAYGQVSSSTGTAVSPLGFTGAYTDPTGLVYLVNRYMDPTTGQFLSVDLLVGLTGQPYSYAQSDPANVTDPTGDACWAAVELGVTAASRACWSSGYSEAYHHPASLLHVISTVSGAVSAVTALIPGLEGVSFGTALIAFGSDLGACALGSCDYAAIGLDALSLIPGAAALRFANRSARDAAELTALEEAGKLDPALKQDEGFQKLYAYLAGIAGAQSSGASAIISGFELGTSTPCQIQ